MREGNAGEEEEDLSLRFFPAEIHGTVCYLEKEEEEEEEEEEEKYMVKAFLREPKIYTPGYQSRSFSVFHMHTFTHSLCLSLSFPPLELSLFCVQMRRAPRSILPLSLSLSLSPFVFFQNTLNTITSAPVVLNSVFWQCIPRARGEVPRAEHHSR